LVMCIIKKSYGDHDDYEVYEIKEEGRKLLQDPTYIPEMVRILRREWKL